MNTTKGRETTRPATRAGGKARGRDAGMERQGDRWAFREQAALRKYGAVKLTVYLDREGREQFEAIANRLYPTGEIAPKLSEVMRSILKKSDHRA